MQMIRCASLIAVMAIPMLAGSVQYQINFAPDPTSATGLSVTGEFTYDAATGVFSSFTVQVDSLTFDFVGLPVGVNPAACPGSASSIEFALMTQTLSAGCNAPPGYEWNFFGDAGALIFEFVAGNITSNLPFSLGLSANVILDTGCQIGAPGCPDVGDQEFGSYTVSTASSIPEPGSLPLLLISSVALAGTKRLRGLIRKVLENEEAKAIS